MKAHSSVLNVLLQVLDEGRLTDGKGRTVDFTNTIIILTSNVGAMTLLAGVDRQGNIPPQVEQAVMNEVRNTFKPELLNRLDDIILFRTWRTAQTQRLKSATSLRLWLSLVCEWHSSDCVSASVLFRCCLFLLLFVQSL